MKQRVIDDAFWKLIDIWYKSPDRQQLHALLLSVYEAGQLDASDLDGARWRLLEQELGDVKAKFSHYVTIPQPLRFVPFDEPNETVSIKHATRWRFECVWTEISGGADTIPKFITLLLTERRNQAKEQS